MVSANGKPVQINTRQPSGLKDTIDFIGEVRRLAGEPAMSTGSTINVALNEWAASELRDHRQAALTRAPLVGMTARAGGPAELEALAAMQNQLQELGFADVAEALNVDLVAPPTAAKKRTR